MQCSAIQSNKPINKQTKINQSNKQRNEQTHKKQKQSNPTFSARIMIDWEIYTKLLLKLIKNCGIFKLDITIPLYNCRISNANLPPQKIYQNLIFLSIVHLFTDFFVYSFNSHLSTSLFDFLLVKKGTSYLCRFFVGKKNISL